MIVDTSALIAIIRSESDGPAYLLALSEAVNRDETLTISAANLFEFYLVIDKDRNEVLSSMADAVIDRLSLNIAPVTHGSALGARVANRQFGRGSGSSARLNFGDCFAYALAKETGEPLLYKGNDFAQTDVISAI